MYRAVSDLLTADTLLLILSDGIFWLLYQYFDIRFETRSILSVIIWANAVLAVAVIESRTTILTWMITLKQTSYGDIHVNYSVF